MKIYADRPLTALRQFITDAIVAVWIYASIKAAMWLHDLIQKLASPGRRMESAGGDLANNLAEAGNKIDGVPGVGNAIAAPFDKAAAAARSFADAGREQQEIVGDIALWVSVGLAVLAIALVLIAWLPSRVRWVRRATAAASLRSAAGGQDLLALRALVSQPLRKLTKVDSEVAAKWRAADQGTVAALATLELHSLGLRAPAAVRKAAR